MRLLSLTAIIVFLIDQISKWIVIYRLNLPSREAIEVFPPFLVLRMAWNRGINFGLFSGEAEVTRWALIILSLVISAWVVWWVRAENAAPRGMVSAGLLLGGALGNVADRITLGAVADFLNMSCCGYSNPFSFNIADIAVFAGAFGLILFTGKENTA